MILEYVLQKQAPRPSRWVILVCLMLFCVSDKQVFATSILKTDHSCVVSIGGKTYGIQTVRNLVLFRLGGSYFSFEKQSVLVCTCVVTGAIGAGFFYRWRKKRKSAG